jgi:hypothetical protein
MVEQREQPIAIYLEVGAKRTIAGALSWPGWCRVARDEAGALQALVEYAPRYQRLLCVAGIAFAAPASPASLAVVERLAGGSGTDFGVPELAPTDDTRPMDEGALREAERMLRACWQAFDAAAKAAEGKTLRVGPRGGGRDLTKMVDHVVDAERSYVARLGWRWEQPPAEDLAERAQQVREGALLALAAAARDELPKRGPRGGVFWTPRYFVRRAAWHVLDHAWELEDRIV